MWPPTHLAIGYLAYAAYARGVHGAAPAGWAAVAAVAGAALPDVIDLPLRWAGMVPDVRLFGHTLLVVVPAALLATWLADRRGRRELGIAFAIGIGSHVAGDALWPLLYGEFHELGFLLWPITESRPYEPVKPIATVGRLSITTRTVEYGLLLLGIAVWIRDGLPGVGAVRERAVGE